MTTTGNRPAAGRIRTALDCPQPSYHGQTAPAQPQWAVYLRLSKDKSRKGRRRNEHDTHERQLADIRAWAAPRGIAISEQHIYGDTLSAWKKNARRPEFEKMLAAARRGEVCGILVWHISRFTRRTRDALDFIELYETYRIMIDGPGSGDYDLSTADGRSFFRRAAEKSEHESDLISERVNAKFDTVIPAGLQIAPGRIFGFEVLSAVREFDDDILPVRRDADVAVIREIAARAVNGEKWAHLARDLNERGITTSRGNPWKPKVLAKMIAHPRNGGYLTRRTKGHRCEIIGVMPPEAGEPILDAETYARVQALMASNRPGRPPAVNTYPLSGIATCGGCRRHLVGSANGPGNRRYACPGSDGGCGNSIKAEWLENAVRAEMVKRGADPAHGARVAQADRELDLDREEARAQLADAERELGRLDEELAALSRRRLLQGPEGVREAEYNAMRATYFELIGKQESIRDELQAKLAALPVPAGTDLSPAFTAQEYDAMEPAEKRELVKAFRLAVTLHRAFPDGPRNRLDPRRIVIE